MHPYAKKIIPKGLFTQPYLFGTNDSAVPPKLVITLSHFSTDPWSIPSLYNGRHPVCLT